nr:hypothetical protein [uncultured Flavobacterium sp.]
MKIFLYLIPLLLMNLTVQAQKYEFDLLTKYNSKIHNNVRESLVYSNSKNMNYFIYVNNDSLNKQAKLYDLKKMTSHNFRLIESKTENNLFFEFVYINSETINVENSYPSSELEVKIINNDSINNEIQVDVFKNNKRKKAEMSFVLKGKKNDTNLFPLFRFSCLHPFEFNQNLNLSEKIIVESAKGITLSGESIEYNLVYFEVVKFEILIPIYKKNND